MRIIAFINTFFAITINKMFKKSALSKKLLQVCTKLVKSLHGNTGGMLLKAHASQKK